MWTVVKNYAYCVILFGYHYDTNFNNIYTFSNLIQDEVPLLQPMWFLIAVIMLTVYYIIYCSMAAAFGSGAMFSLVSGFGGPNQAANAVTSGFFFALVQGGIFQVGMKEK